MKKLLLVIGVGLLVMGLLQIGKYIFDYYFLSEFEKGYVWGSVLLILLGGVFVYFGWKRD